MIKISIIVTVCAKIIRKIYILIKPVDIKYLQDCKIQRHATLSKTTQTLRSLLSNPSNKNNDEVV